jgi:hypothetical protein
MMRKNGTTATQDFIDKGIDAAEGDEALLDFISNQNDKKVPKGQWGATANGWAQTTIIRKK